MGSVSAITTCMPIKLCANLTMMFQTHDLARRTALAAQAGFRGIEVLFPYQELEGTAFREVLDEHHLTPVLINAAGGAWTAAERGIGALPKRQAEFREAFDHALDYANTIGCKNIHVMAGLVPDGADDAPYWDAFCENLSYASVCAAAAGVTVLIEPLNTKIDMPRYLLHSSADALWVLEHVASPNLMLQYDLYHMHIMENGARADALEPLLPQIGHIQLADHPGRNEPGSGEIGFDALLPALEQMGYQGWIGCEYHEKHGLNWAKPWLG